MSNNESARSLPSNALGARVSPDPETTPVEPRREGPPAPSKPSAYHGHVRTVDDLKPSTAPNNVLPGASKIAEGVKAALAKYQVQQDAFAGIDTSRRDAANLDAAVRKGQMTPDMAAGIFQALHPQVKPEDLQS